MSNEDADQAEDAQSRKSPLAEHRWTIVLCLLILFLFLWYVVADRLTPYTASARVQTYIVPVVPDVSSYVAEIPIKQFQLVESGDTLIKLDTKRFEYALQAAEAGLAAAGQEVGATTAEVATAAANVTAAEVRLDNARVQAQRLFALEDKGVVPRSQADQARAEIANSEAALNAANAELERARATLGDEGQQNAGVQMALAELREAQLNLARTTLVAPGRGLVGNLNIDEGTYATAGQPLLSFVAIDDVWIEAYMTENNLAHIAPGSPVELAIDALPGRVLKGFVRSTAPGVSTGVAESRADLPSVQQARAWLRDPQRYPVIIDLADYEFGTSQKSHGLRHNGQVDVIVYTGDSFIWNTLGKLWIRLVSVFSYLY